MKRILILSVLMLVGCSNKLNEFEYADAGQQTSFALLVGVDESSDNYFRLLKNNDIVYFDTKFEDDVIINPKDEFESEMKDIIVGIYYDSFVETETTTYNKIEYIQEGSNNVQKNMRKYGYDGDFIYVMRDANGDLVFRMTNGEVDYSYFDTKEAKEIYGEYINDDEISNDDKLETEVNEMDEKRVAQIQYRIDENERYLVSSNNPYTDTKVYAQSVVSCAGQCESKYMTYEEAIELVDGASEIGGWEGEQVYHDWWNQNKSRIQKNN